MLYENLSVAAYERCLLLETTEVKAQNQSGRKLWARINICLLLSQDILGVKFTGIN
jgi:hypothetical protein